MTWRIPGQDVDREVLLGIRREAAQNQEFALSAKGLDGVFFKAEAKRHARAVRVATFALKWVDNAEGGWPPELRNEIDLMLSIAAL